MTMEKIILHITKFSTMFSAIVMLATFALFASSFDALVVAGVYVTALLSFAVVSSKRAEIDRESAENARIRFEALYNKFRDELHTHKERSGLLAKQNEELGIELSRRKSDISSLRAEIGSLRAANQELSAANIRLAQEKLVAETRLKTTENGIKSIQADYDSLIKNNREMGEQNALLRKEVQDLRFSLETERNTLEDVNRKYKSLVNSVNAKARVSKQSS